MRAVSEATDAEMLTNDPISFSRRGEQADSEKGRLGDEFYRFGGFQGDIRGTLQVREITCCTLITMPTFHVA